MATTSSTSKELALLTVLGLNRGELTPAALEWLLERLRRLRSSR